MTALRQDAWSEEEDLMLAEVVLKNIREGGTQLQAFEEVGKKLERTSAACGFRWNATIRKKYDEAVKIAKQQKKKQTNTEKKEAVPAAVPASVPDDSENKQGRVETEQSLRLEDVIAYLRKLEKEERDSGTLKDSLAKEQEKTRKLAAEKENLKQELARLRHDYKSFLSMLDRAREWQGEKET
ncbi:RsfA family transcriptional regulator [Salicibibacter kimchii]|uniref:RsfA family transcriptional regulator n=1 Tax=Salicibibacter kimchii TaxID=2099786 RepID=A0A345BX00_9BACI|nr:RsfA family transcriptional regulator [Salicibibacter kimchii]AXF55481.1 RsfA family transcriptional regulator [Salicibibacter kimchii]